MKSNLIIFLLLSFASLSAQQPFFYKVDSDAGLPSDEVYEVAQDSFGYIWIGCDAGLFRYDGVNFKSYRHSLQSGRSISHIIIDKAQRVWCQNFSGQIFYAFEDSLYLFKDFSVESRSFPLFDIDKKNNHLWIATDSMVQSFDILTKQKLYETSKIPTRQGTYSGNISFKLFAGNVFTSTSYLELINTESKVQRQIDISPFFEILARDFFDFGDDLIFFFHKIDRSVYQFVQVKDSTIELINTISADLAGHLIYQVLPLGDQYILGTSDGVKITNKRFETQKSFLPNEKISDILKDREGNLWLTSLQNGIYVIPSLELETFSDDFFPESNVTALAVHENELVIGTYSGDLFYLDPIKNTFEIQERQGIGEYGTVKAFGYYQNEWLIARRSTVIIDNKEEKRKLKPSNVRAFIEMEDTLFSVTSGNVSKFSNNKIKTIQKKSGRAITKHPNKNIIYYATENNFFKYKNGQSSALFYNDKRLYPSDFAWQGDTLWISTITDGLFLFFNDKCIQHISHGKSLPGTTLRKLYRYQDRILIATDVGVVNMDLKTKAFTLFDASDGLRQKEINALEVIDNVLYVGTPRGLVRFPLTMNARNRIIPNIHIDYIKANNNVLAALKNIRLPYNENNITIGFKSAMMRSRGDFNYEYRLIGLDDNWKKVSSKDFEVDYNTLPSGDFQFEVRGINEDNVKSPAATLLFVIEKPIWARWWFLGVVFFLVFGVSYWLVQRRIRNIQRQANIENELKSSQLTAIKAQMNPHFLYNALNSIQDLILQKDIRGASRYLSKFSLLMRQVLEVSSSMSISMTREIEILQLYLDLEKLRFGDDFQYELQSPDGYDFDDFQIPSMIIQPFVENAVKHGLLHKVNGQKELSINFQISDTIICTIIDNGVGRVHSAKIKARRGIQPVSFATSATQRRLDILNQTHSEKIGFEIIDLYENEVATGTKVILTIPIWSEV